MLKVMLDSDPKNYIVDDIITDFIDILKAQSHTRDLQDT